MEKLFVSPISEIREINEDEEVRLSPEEVRLISKNYNSYWKQYNGIQPVKDVHTFFWEELENWGHPAVEKRNQSIRSLSQVLESLRNKYKIRLNEY